ncbi:MFS transporter [Actinoplanes sp. NPDC026670]|uniref:MFS transporter n=1 Tax=Actinoplanes sp. NPDC026670 TaxID=3154700 RepID=UPI0033D6F83D
MQAVTFVLRPTATYQALDLAVPTAYLGMLGASFAVVPLVLATPAGQIVDRFGERRMLITGPILLALSVLSFIAWGDTVPGLIAATMLLGIGHLCAVVAQQALVANRTPAGRYDTAFGYYTFAASLGQALGPGLIIIFGGGRTVPDTHAIFLGTLAITAPLLVIAVLLRPSAAVSARPDSGPGGFRELLARPGLPRALLVSCIVLAAVDITLVYLPALGTERGIAAGTVGVLLTLRALASMTSRLFLGRLSAAVGRHHLLVGTVAISAAGLLLMLIPMPLWLMAVLIVITGLGLGAGQPLTMSFLAEAAPPGLRGRAMSLRLTGNRLGQVVIPSTAGVLAVGAGATGVLALTAAGLAAAAYAAGSLPPTERTDGE